MKKIGLILGIYVVAITLTVSNSAHSQEKKETPEDMSAPSAEHQEIAKYAGDWNVEMHFVSDKENVYAGSSINSMIVGGRFLQIQFSLNKGDSDVEGAFILGFDRRNLEYQILAMDSWGTYYVTASGKRSEKTGAIKMYGKDNDPKMKKMGWGVKEFGHICRFKNEKHFTIEIFFIDTRTDARTELKSMEYKFTRVEDK